MTNFDSELVATKLGAILTLVNNGEAQEAVCEIGVVVDQLKLAEDSGPLLHPANHDRAPLPWRLISAHLKAAEIQIEATHIAPATESIQQAIYIAMHGSGPEVPSAWPDPQFSF